MEHFLRIFPITQWRRARFRPYYLKGLPGECPTILWALQLHIALRGARRGRVEPVGVGAPQLPYYSKGRGGVGSSVM